MQASSQYVAPYASIFTILFIYSNVEHTFGKKTYITKAESILENKEIRKRLTSLIIAYKLFRFII